MKSIDDTIMCMVGMGFELEDCQAAVENGKLSVNEAVDWLVMHVMKFSDDFKSSIKFSIAIATRELILQVRVILR